MSKTAIEYLRTRGTTGDLIAAGAALADATNLPPHYLNHPEGRGTLLVRSNRYAVRSYSFIFRHSVTVLMFNACAARLRLPLNRSRARRINSRS